MISSMKDHRDRWFLLALLAHAPATFVIGTIMSGESFLHVFGEAVAPAVAALVAYALIRNTRTFRAAGAVLLMLYSGVIIHLGAGLVEWHFHIFVAMAMLVLYFDWLPIVVAAGTAAVHHIVLDEVLPTALFNHGDALSRGVVLVRAIFVVIHTVVLLWMAESIRRTAGAVETAIDDTANESAGAVEEGLAALAAGDLTVTAHVAEPKVLNVRGDEIGRMASKVNSLGASFRSMLAHYEGARSGLTEIVEEVRTAASELCGQVDAMSTKVDALAETADGLLQLVGRFKLAESADDDADAADIVALPLAA